MKLTFNKPRPSLLKPGQIWERGGTYYLAVAGAITGVRLYALPYCNTTWDEDKGFSGDDEEFTYVDILELE